MKKLLTLLIIAAALTSCQKEPDWGKLSNELLVYTHYDQEFDYSNNYTFYIPDSILLLDNSQEEAVYIDDNDPRARNIIEVLTNEMTRCGYTQVYDRTQADLGIITSYVKRSNTYVDYYYPYWWYDFYYYWPFDYWDPYYIDWYPYYPYPVAYTYTTGTLVVEMMALNKADHTNKKLPFVWTACMVGAESSNQLNISHAIAGIYQAFEQSPYMQAQ